MPSMLSNRLLMAVVLGVVLAWIYMRFAVPRGAPAFPIVIGYDKIGEAVDRLGVPYNWINTGR